MQQAVLLHQGKIRCTEVSVPRPPADHHHINPSAFRDLLPHCDPEHLLLAACPFSALLGTPILVVYDASSQQEHNPCATRLTISIEHGLGVQINGDAVALCPEPGMDFTLQKWAELDNCIYGELISFYERGHRPSQEELQGIVDDFKAGRFRYADQAGSEDEDANKDDGGKELSDAMGENLLGSDEADGGGAIPRPASGVNWRPLVGEGHPGVVS